VWGHQQNQPLFHFFKLCGPEHVGTPSGAGMGMKPQVFLKNGDKIKLSIYNLGEQN